MEYSPVINTKRLETFRLVDKTTAYLVVKGEKWLSILQGISKWLTKWIKQSEYQYIVCYPLFRKDGRMNLGVLFVFNEKVYQKLNLKVVGRGGSSLGIRGRC